MWSWLVGAVLGPLFGAISNWLQAEQARLDEQRLGQTQQALADETEQTLQAVAEQRQTVAATQAENSVLLAAVSDPGSLRLPSPDSRD